MNQDKSPNNIFISYSRKDSIDVAEFRSITKYRDFEILIDDEEITFDQPWKANIRNKIKDSKGAILFISNNALNPESPIRTLELPLIAKRFNDPEDDFYFFPILLEDIDKEVFESYSFKPKGEKEEVGFLDYFQLYDLQSEKSIKDLNTRKRKKEYQIFNANISNALQGGTLSPGRKMIQKARQRKLAAFGSLAGLLFVSWLLFSQTTTYSYLRIETLIYLTNYLDGGNTTETEGVSAFDRYIAEELNEAAQEAEEEGLELDESIIENLEKINLSGSVDGEDTTTTTTTTVAPSTTTTVPQTSTTTTTTVPQTTTTTTSGSADTSSPNFTQELTATNITTGEVDLSWSASDNIGISYYVLKEGSSEVYRGGNTSKELEGLISGTAYTLTIFAYDAAGNSDSSTVSFSTLGSSSSSTTTTTTVPQTSTTTTTTIVDNVGPTISGFSVAEVNTWNAKLVWNASDDSGILKYSISCSKSENAAIAQSFTQEIGTGGRNYFWINSGSNDPWDTSGDEIEYWNRDHDFDATCTLTAYDNSPNQNTSSSTISWHTERVPTGFFLDDANWVASDQICIRGGTSYTDYLNVNVVIRANGVQKNTYSNTSGGFLVTGLSADTNYTISVTFTDQYGRSETLESSHASLNTFTSNSSYWSSLYSSFPSSCYGISASPTTTTTTTTTTTIPATPSLLSFAQESTSNDGGCFAYEASGTDAHKYNWKVNGSQVIEGQVGTFDMADNYHKGTYCVTGQGSGVSVTVEFNFFLFDGTLVSSQSITFTTN
ncbi:TIR domain-containing protein [bacterium]|nr:TIR domain-containing protein [bacterium]